MGVLLNNFNVLVASFKVVVNEFPSMFRNMNEVCLNSVVILFWILIK